MKKPALPKQDLRWHRHASDAAMTRDVADRLAALANDCIARQGAFSIVLSGGDTPRSVYEQLRTLQTDWSRWHIYFGDERCLQANVPGRNDRMARDALLDHVPVPLSQAHSIPAELPQAEAVAHYTQLLTTVGTFDLVLLGIGEDGHTASLFPGHAWGKDAGSPPVLAVERAPQEPPKRITLSAHRLSNTHQLWFLVSGKKKENILLRWQQGEFLPVSVINPPGGIDVFVAPGNLP